jgi:hypothetical protein
MVDVLQTPRRPVGPGSWSAAEHTLDGDGTGSATAAVVSVAVVSAFGPLTTST